MNKGSAGEWGRRFTELRAEAFAIKGCGLSRKQKELMKGASGR
jgi:hypothetical protein